MKKLFIVANWKSNETTAEANVWFQTFNSSNLTINKDEKEIIICPPFTLLALVKELSPKSQTPFAIGAQDVSPFDEGAYTGEENVKQIKEFADYVIIGHSERRKNFSETDEIISKKVGKAIEGGLTPILCVQGPETPIPGGVDIVAYEPVSAIGTGTPDTPEDADSVAKIIKEKNAVKYVLYGGSVLGENVAGFTNLSSIDGVLVGGASLAAEKFLKIIENS
ncbi:MAG TPA: triose-phosphate isomerase family protein [Candidatus Limnocylindrales bacterium]|nr:triose-phosphate isomerase family protein [Candidatus Limnocylindrales bacterium]